MTLACFQLILDRGPGEDWFSSGEICTYAVVSGMGMWMFFTHTLTAQHPFFDRELLRDRQFLTATVMGFFLGVLMFASTAMTPPLLQQLMGYPVLTAGLITVPRGIGMATALILMSRVPAHIDTRLILVLSLIFNAIATGMMAGYDLSMDSRLVMTSGVLSGAGVGLLFVSLTSLAFPTITPVLRPQASAMFNLVRNMGMSVGISVLQALLASNTQAMHGSMTAHLDPSSPMVRSALPSTFNLTTEAGVMGLNAEITRQATMVAYDNDFRLLMYASLVCLCLTPLLRSPRAVAAGRR